MKRLLSTLQLDIRLQLRNGLYYASGFVAVAFVVVLKQFPALDLNRLWPAIILENLVLNAYYFMGGLVLLEKGEGTLEVQITTPLRTEEYLLSKVLTLGALSLAETLVLVVLVQGLRFAWLPLIAGILLMVALYALYGFVIVSRYDSINEWLLPSALWTLGFSLPLISYFDLWQSWIFYLHPLQAPMTLIQAAFETVAGWQLVYALLYGALWVGVVAWLSRRAFYRFVITKQGAR
ncbi:MAG: ABC transporter permease [Anaerolineae bacterium]|nr:ABC transporter permease [Anaerolineae bacterium]